MSTYPRNYSGVNESQNFEPLPEGTYDVKIERIEDSQTKAGAPMIKVRYVVLNGMQHGRKLFDQVVLFEDNAKGAGITKHFLHVIGEPYEGAFEIVPDNWVGKKLSVKVNIDPKYNNNKVEAREFMEQIPF